MTRLRDIRLPWDEDLRSAPFSVAEPDALDPISRYRNVNRSLLRRRLDEEDERVNPRVTSVGDGLVGGLRKKTGGFLRQAQDAIADADIGPVASQVGKLASMIDVPAGVAIRAAGEASPSIRKGRSFLQDVRDIRENEMPTIAASEQIDPERKMFGGMSVLGLPVLGLAASIGSPDPGDVLKGAAKAEKIASHIPASTKFSRFGGAIEPEEITKALSKVSETPVKPPTDFGGSGAVIRPGVAGVLDSARAYFVETSDKVLRRIAGMRFVDKEAAEGLANTARNVIRDETRFANAGTDALDGPLQALKTIKDKKARARGERLVAWSMETGNSTGDELLDTVADELKGWTNAQREGLVVDMARFYDKNVETPEQALKVLATNKVEIPEKLDNYLPHIHDRLFEAVRDYEDNAARGIESLRDLYKQSGEAVPDDATLKGTLDGIISERDTGAGDVTKRLVRTFAGNVEAHRTLNIPGHILDWRRQDWEPGTLGRGMNAYNDQIAFRRADALWHGARGERFFEWMDKIQGPAKEWVKEYREKLVSHSGADPVTRSIGGAGSALRSLNAYNMLGYAIINNAFQTMVTTLPESFKGVSTIKGLQNFSQGMGSAVGEFVKRGDAVARANRAGATYDRLLSDLAQTGGEGAIQKATRFTMRPFGHVEQRLNNVGSFVVGTLSAEDWADEIARGGKRAVEAENQLRKYLETEPALMEQAIAIARSGQKLPDNILDNVGYEMARRTQLRGDPTMVPLRWSGAGGKLVTQFSNFGFGYSRFIKDDLIKYGVKSRDWRPMLVWAASGLATGEAIRLARGLARGEYSPAQIDEALKDDVESITDPGSRFIRKVVDGNVEYGALVAMGQAIAGTMSYSGGFGKVGDLGETIATGNIGRIAKDVSGPTIAGALDLTSRLAGDVRNLEFERTPKFLAERVVPGVVKEPVRRALRNEPVWGMDVPPLTEFGSRPTGRVRLRDIPLRSR